MIRKYDKYKDSGVEWIGEIPEGWECCMIKRLSPVRRGASPRPIHDPKYFDNEGEFAWVRIADVSASERYLENTTQTLSELGSSLSVKRYPGDLFLSIAGTVGKPIISRIKCCIHDGFVYFPKLELNAEYLYYLFSTGLPYQGLGKWGTQLNLNTDTVGEIVIPTPSKSEAAEVVAFLDRKTAEIDQLIARKEKLITLYEEEKTAIINRAVTKGLNPQVKTKPSGIEWLGNIPEHWEVKRFKYLGKFINGYSFNSSDFTSIGIRVMKISNIQTMKLDWSDESFVEEAFYDKYETFRVQRNDLVFALTRPIISTGIKAAIVDTDERVLLNQRNSMFKATEVVHTKWMYYLILNNRFVQEFDKQIDKTGQQPNISSNDIAEISVPVPALSEQIEIIIHIETECSRLDTIIGKFKKQIELFKEYRTTLISEVVTGKIDVRDEVAA